MTTMSLCQSFADRLAELPKSSHERVRVELWGYEQSKAVAAEDLFEIKYTGN